MIDRPRQITVLRAGSLTLIEDGGRAGLGHLAVPPSGALDTRSWRLANRLVGNEEDAAVLETTMNGVAFQVGSQCVAAITGALAPVTVDGRPAAWGIPLMLTTGQVLNVGLAIAGVRSYVALSGGVDVSPIFSSRATDLLSGLGPLPLFDGDVLPLGPIHAPAPPIDFAPYATPLNEICLLLHLGPRYNWLSKKARDTLARETWTVGTNSNRIALRLEGPPLVRARNEELPSEGIVTGAVQLPPDGQPLIFLADHPTTGGYPVVGVVDDQSLALCAQARPGTVVSFHPRTLPWSVPWVREAIRISSLAPTRLQ
ncbi:MAG: 5-oxoprolinase subunit C family protein [Ferrimicrobium sp.]